MHKWDPDLNLDLVALGRGSQGGVGADLQIVFLTL